MIFFYGKNCSSCKKMNDHLIICGVVGKRQTSDRSVTGSRQSFAIRNIRCVLLNLLFWLLIFLCNKVHQTSIYLLKKYQIFKRFLPLSLLEPPIICVQLYFNFFYMKIKDTHQNASIIKRFQKLFHENYLRDSLHLKYLFFYIKNGNI